jgi:hypothetical protein
MEHFHNDKLEFFNIIALYMYIIILIFKIKLFMH